MKHTTKHIAWDKDTKRAGAAMKHQVICFDCKAKFVTNGKGCPQCGSSRGLYVNKQGRRVPVVTKWTVSKKPIAKEQGQ